MRSSDPSRTGMAMSTAVCIPERWRSCSKSLASGGSSPHATNERNRAQVAKRRFRRGALTPSVSPARTERASAPGHNRRAACPQGHALAFVSDPAVWALCRRGLRPPRPAFRGGSEGVVAPIREQQPLLHSDAHGGFWLLSRYADVTGAALDWQSFTSAVPGVTIIPPSQPRTYPL